MSPAKQALNDRRLEKADKVFSHLAPDAVAELLSTAADLVLVLDAKGVIVDLAVGEEDLLSKGCHKWRGKPWVQTVTVESQPKVQALLGQSEGATGAAWRHINHPMPDGVDLPLAYSLVTLPSAGTGPTHSVAFARDLRPQMTLQQRLVTAQLSMERDYWRLRQAETRYRLLFQLASEPVIILDGALEKVSEINPAAQALLGDKASRAGVNLAEQLDGPSLSAMRDMLDRLRSIGRCEPVLVRLRNGQEFMAAASQFREDQTLQFLLRLCTQASRAAPSAPSTHQLLWQAMEQAPDAMAITDLDGRVLTVNQAFVDLGQLGAADLARGQLLDTWLGRSGVDLRVLLTNLRQHGVVRLFATQMRGELGATAEVEISAVSVSRGEDKCLGFTIREMGRRLASDVRAPRELPRSASQMTELVGRMPLKDIVRETTDLIEQLCIEAALQLTGDNRASAAEMLGLSRQSLYIKLRRFDMVDGSIEPLPEPGDGSNRPG
jgi:transcriptional regulator PpsR